MKALIGIAAILLCGATLVWSGYNLEHHIQGERREALEERYAEAFDAEYVRGLKDGAEGIKVEYNSVWRILWAKYGPKYGSIHATPWEEFELEEKMFLCAYGSPGNTLSRQDMMDVANKYGPLTGEMAWDNRALRK